MSKPHNDDRASRNLFGAFGGVFTPCILTILGVIMFMRSNFVIGEAGILGAVAILLIAKSITLFTALSASAIATNMQVRGGGAYFLISRVLGPEFGGAIGIVLFLAQAVSAPFYVLGFTEALVQTIPALAPHYAAIAFGTAGALFIVAYIGAGWAIKVQYGIMAILAVSIMAFMGGALTRFSPETFSTNWLSGYTLLHANNPNGGAYSFWMVFAIYFPAVTGIMAGINMSGDLKDPSRAIPRGILGAIGVGFLIYLAQIFISGGAFERADLLERPYLVLKEHALFGAGFIVAAGMFAATLSSALGSFLGAPRVLQAVGRDRIMPALQAFAKGTAQGDEPRRAMLATGAITATVLLWAVTAKGNALDLVAGIITMFFLYTYGMLNIAAFLEAVTGNPSFRPRFRFFHWATGLAGGLGCAAVAFVIDARQATAAIILLALIVWYIKARELRVAFGDAWRGLVYKTARNSLVRLSTMEEDPKNWRPTTLVFSGNPELRETLVTYAVWIGGGRGVVFLASVLVGRFEDYAPRRGAAIQQLEEFCRKRDVHAFPVVLISEELEQGVAAVLQATSVGPIRPNLVMLGWSGTAEQAVAAVPQLRVARVMDMGLVVVRSGGNPLIGTCRRIDIWWRGRKNGGLMVLLGHLLTRNWEWSRASVRLLRIENSEAAREGTLNDLEELLRASRVDATAHVIISDDPFETVFREESAGADCVFLGFEIPKEEDAAAWYQRYECCLEGMPTTILVCATGEEDATA
ncbi:MAG: amino acid permease [Nitrospiraceae bacterium]|nr:amino acid permease [Nitrospiraceae bacterium]